MSINIKDTDYLVEDKEANEDFTSQELPFGTYESASLLVKLNGTVNGIFYLDVGIGNYNDIIWDESVSEVTCIGGLFSSGKSTESFNITSSHSYLRIRFINEDSFPNSSYSILFNLKNYIQSA